MEVMRDTTDEVTQTRQRQIELYGEPLQDVLGRCAAILRLTQVRMAEYLGISAPDAEPVDQWAPNQNR